MTTGKIFICYRRSETAWAARALFERLWREFDGEVFIDIAGLARGRNFKAAIDKQLEGCAVCLAVIGPKWGDQIKERMADEDEPDWVRIELARVLERDIPVVPVLVDGGKLPRAKDLPENLRELTERHGLELESKSFDDQMTGLVTTIKAIFDEASPAALSPTEGLIVAASTFHRLEIDSAESHGAAQVTAPSLMPPAAPAIAKPRATWMSDEGTDQFGRWAEFKVDSVIQRLRWIEPGEFWMGSTEAERRRFAEGLTEQQVKDWLDPERPRHRVRLTQGYWLADTACTQALWQAVTGDNPSKFTGDLQLPVEQVSWNDITKHFLPELNRRVPGLKVSVPTEAHWEYACRAGTDTAYSFGETITPEQVNFNGNNPPPSGAKGIFVEKTVPVKAMPANAWGLYQMHGNVLEWCADGRRTYEAGAVSDPVRRPPRVRPR